MQTIIFKVTVPDKHAEAMRKHLERLATEDVRVSPVEFARRHGFKIKASVADETPLDGVTTKPRVKT